MAAAAADGPSESHSWRGLVAVAVAAAVMATGPLWAGRGGARSPSHSTVLDAVVDREAPPTTTTAGPLPVVTVDEPCAPAGARGVTETGSPVICAPANGRDRPNGDDRARWRHV